MNFSGSSESDCIALIEAFRVSLPMPAATAAMHPIRMFSCHKLSLVTCGGVALAALKELCWEQ